MATKIAPSKKARCRVRNFRDAGGNPAPVDPTQSTVTLSDPTAFVILEVIPSPDALIAVVGRTGPEGTCQVQLSPDANLDPEGVKPLPFIFDLETMPGEAVTGDADVVVEDA